MPSGAVDSVGAAVESKSCLLDEVMWQKLRDVSANLQGNSFYQYLISIDGPGGVVFKRFFDYVFSEIDVLLELEEESCIEHTEEVSLNDLKVFIELAKNSIYSTLIPGLPFESVFAKQDKKYVIKHIVSLFSGYNLFVQSDYFRVEKGKNAAVALVQLLHAFMGGEYLLKFFENFFQDKVTIACSAAVIDSIDLNVTKYVFVAENTLVDPSLSSDEIKRAQLLALIFGAIGDQQLFQMRYNDDLGDSDYLVVTKNSSVNSVVGGDKTTLFEQTELAVQQQCSVFEKCTAGSMAIPDLIRILNDINECVASSGDNHPQSRKMLVVERNSDVVKPDSLLMLNAQIARLIINPFLLYLVLDGIACANVNLRWLALPDEVLSSLRESNTILSMAEFFGEMPSCDVGGYYSNIHKTYCLFNYELNGIVSLEKGYYQYLLGKSKKSGIDTPIAALERMNETFVSLTTGSDHGGEIPSSLFYGIPLKLINYLISKIFFPYSANFGKDFQVSIGSSLEEFVKDIFSSRARLTAENESCAETISAVDVEQLEIAKDYAHLAIKYAHLNPFVFASKIQVLSNCFCDLNERFSKEQYSSFLITKNTKLALKDYTAVFKQFSFLVNVAAINDKAAPLSPEVYLFARKCGFFVRELKLIQQAEKYSEVLADSKDISLAVIIEVISNMQAAFKSFVEGDNNAAYLFKDVPVNILNYILQVFFKSSSEVKSSSSNQADADLLNIYNYRPFEADESFISRFMSIKGDSIKDQPALDLTLAAQLSGLNFFALSDKLGHMRKGSVGKLNNAGISELELAL